MRNWTDSSWTRSLRGFTFPASRLLLWVLLLFLCLSLFLQGASIVEARNGAQWHCVLPRTASAQKIWTRSAANTRLAMQKQWHAAVVSYLHPTLGQHLKVIVALLCGEKNPIRPTQWTWGILGTHLLAQS